MIGLQKLILIRRMRDGCLELFGPEFLHIRFMTEATHPSRIQENLEYSDALVFSLKI